LVSIVAGVLGAERLGPGQQRVLDRLQGGGDGRDELGAADRRLVLGRLVAAADEDRVLVDVARPDLEAQRHALLDPLPDLVAAAQIAIVEFDPQRAPGELLLPQLGLEGVAVVEDALPVLGLVGDRDDHDVGRGQPRRADHAVVVGVGHDQASRPGAC
jgi:hypothetical protein